MLYIVAFSNNKTEIDNRYSKQFVYKHQPLNKVHCYSGCFLLKASYKKRCAYYNNIESRSINF